MSGSSPEDGKTKIFRKVVKGKVNGADTKQDACVYPI
jgi:hypothetical protein